MKTMIEINEAAYNPEKPSLHRGQWYPHSVVLKDEREENERNAERRVEIVENEVDDQAIGQNNPVPCRRGKTRLLVVSES